MLGFDFPDLSDLLARLRRIHLVKDVVKRHDLHALARKTVYVFLQGNKRDAVCILKASAAGEIPPLCFVAFCEQKCKLSM